MKKESPALIIAGALILLLSIEALGASPAPKVPGTSKGTSKGAVQSTNKAVVGEWADNGEVKIKVSKVQEVTAWSSLPFSKRYTPAKEASFSSIKAMMDKGEAKIVLVTTEVKNTSTSMRNIGWCTIPASPGNFYLRGDEGSEQTSTNKNNFYGDFTQSIGKMGDLSSVLSGAFPMDSKVSPGGSAAGSLLYIVPSWFTPAVLFTKPGYAGTYMGKNEIIIKLKH
ncbi:MAG: hypothetical protein RDV48_27395 [Candidatus Eremiobacteraeota bacterium]|nr:hypothetical protein [Candidatus Eremiobacteraeota bacterium]